MKPAAFEYCRPRDLAEAVRAMAQGGEEARVIAGGQSLGPMLNLRLVTPSLLVDLSRLAALREIAADDETLTLGAAVTHAEIEDGAGGDETAGLLPRVASGIAYRPVRNRGTIGGSLGHADPAGDWAPVMMALGATIEIRGPGGTRTIPAAALILSPLTTALAGGEIMTALRIPRLAKTARWGHVKFCRKPGDFAESLAVVVLDAERGVARVILGSRSGVPARLPATEACLIGDRGGDRAALGPALEADLERRAAPENWTAYDRSLHRAGVTRALREALA